MKPGVLDQTRRTRLNVGHEGLEPSTNGLKSAALPTELVAQSVNYLIRFQKRVNVDLKRTFRLGCLIFYPHWFIFG